MALLIRGVKVIDESSAYHLQTVDIFIEKGIVQSIGQSLKATTDNIIDHPHLCISMGWVDVFADYREPGYEHKETIATGLASAAAGGFTSVMIAPNTNPTISSKSVVQYIKMQAEGNAVSLFPIGSVSHNIEGKNLAEMLDMQANGAIAFSDGWKPIQNASLLLKALEYVKSFEGTVIQIPMDANLSAGGLMHEGEGSTQLGMPGIPTLAETLQLHRDIELLRYTNSRLHITGIAAAESVELIRQAKADGLNITCSVTPYHLALNDEALRGYDSLYKVMPPIRSEKDRLALIDGLKDGTIDCIATHHRPQEWDAKAKEFEYASEGMNVQEFGFAISNDATKNELTIEQLINALANRPSAIFGLRKDGIREGAYADFTLFSTNESTQLNEMKSRVRNNPFLGKSLLGKVLGIIKSDTLVLND